MNEENIIEIPACKIDNPPPEEEWGTKMAKYRGEVEEFRGEVFQLFGIVDQNMAVDEWVSADDYPHIARCIKKVNGGNSTIEIVDVKLREEETK